MRYRTLAFGLALVLLSLAAFAAVDTADKRGSVLNMTGSVLPVPNGGIDAGDRAQLAGVYRGIVAAEAATLQRKNLLGLTLRLN